MPWRKSAPRRAARPNSESDSPFSRYVRDRGRAFCDLVIRERRPGHRAIVRHHDFRLFRAREKQPIDGLWNDRELDVAAVVVGVENLQEPLRGIDLCTRLLQRTLLHVM